MPIPSAPSAAPTCGDMLRMWVKFKDQDGRKVIDRATFQTFGCQTAIAVASVATEMIAGKTVDEALALSGEELAAPLGALPPMKIHCAQLVEGALALRPRADRGDDSRCPAPAPSRRPASTTAPTLYDQLNGGQTGKKLKVKSCWDNRTPEISYPSSKYFLMHENSEITLSRDVEAIQIPSGNIVTLPAGMTVVITQSLGGSYTVASPTGLSRITEGRTPTRSAWRLTVRSRQVASFTDADLDPGQAGKSRLG